MILNAYFLRCLYNCSLLHFNAHSILSYIDLIPSQKLFKSIYFIPKTSFQMRILFIFLSNLAGKEAETLASALVRRSYGNSSLCKWYDILVGKSADDFNELNKAFGHLLKSTGVADMETFLDIEVSHGKIGYPFS